MRTFILASFVLGLVVFIARVIFIGISEWPKERDPLSLGSVVGLTISGLAWTVWAGVVLWLGN